MSATFFCAFGIWRWDGMVVGGEGRRARGAVHVNKVRHDKSGKAVLIEGICLF